jgi:hypothetical protein
VNCPIAREISLRPASDSAIGDGVLMVGVADLRYVLNCRDMQHRTSAIRKSWVQNKNTEQCHVDSRTVAAYQSSPNRFASGPPATSSPRHIRVASEQELKDRMILSTSILVHTWSYKLDEAA